MVPFPMDVLIMKTQLRRKMYAMENFIMGQFQMETLKSQTHIYGKEIEILQVIVAHQMKQFKKQVGRICVMSVDVEQGCS